MGAFCCHGNQRFDPICPKTLCSLSPTQWCYTYNLIKFGPLASEIFKFESVDDGRRRRTDDGPLVYYKLTLWAFGSGELTRQQQYVVFSHFLKRTRFMLMIPGEEQHIRIEPEHDKTHKHLYAELTCRSILAPVQSGLSLCCASWVTRLFLHSRCN